MTKNLLDLSGKIDQQSIDLFRLVNQITTMLDMPYLVVGATARDIVYHHRFGTPVRRATTDIDFGIQVRSWPEFESLSQKLVSEGFKLTKSAHRFFSPNNTQLDFVPFGLIEDEMANIQWPPNGDVEMNVLGFKEALDHAFQVNIASAHMLGRDSAAIAHDTTRRRTLEIIDSNLISSAENILVVEMCKQVEVEYEKYLNLLNAYANGLRQ